MSKQRHNGCPSKFKTLPLNLKDFSLKHVDQRAPPSQIWLHRNWYKIIGTPCKSGNPKRKPVPNNCLKLNASPNMWGDVAGKFSYTTFWHPFPFTNLSTRLGKIGGKISNVDLFQKSRSSIWVKSRKPQSTERFSTRWRCGRDGGDLH